MKRLVLVMVLALAAQPVMAKGLKVPRIKVAVPKTSVPVVPRVAPRPTPLPPKPVPPKSASPIGVEPHSPICGFWCGYWLGGGFRSSPARAEDKPCDPKLRAEGLCPKPAKK